MNILRQNKKTQEIVTIQNFLSEAEINQIFDLCEEREFVDSSIGKDLDKEKQILLEKYNIKDLNNGVIKSKREANLKWIYLDDQSNWLFNKVINCINQVNAHNYHYILKFVEDFQFSEYNSLTRGFYSKHVDCGNVYDIENFVDIRKLSFSIQLSNPEDYEGGDIKFYGKKSIYTNEKEYDIARKDKGTIIFFPSHILHEVTPITKGIRYSLVSWVLGPNIL
jgi:hypothetical protein